MNSKPIQMLQKSHPSPWKAIATANPNPTKQPREVKNETKTLEEKSKQPTPKGAKINVQQPKSTKKNNKPQLQSVSIADMITVRPGQQMVKKGKQMQQQQQQRPQKPPNPTMDLTKDFPTLGSHTRKLDKSKPTFVKPSWGKAAASSKVPTHPVVEKSTQPDTSKKSQKEKSIAAPTLPSAAMFFQPKMDVPREGDEHQLLRLLQDRNVYQKKGRQRLHPRKKKFTALKKKVLQERLQKWRELHPDDKKDDNPSTPCSTSSVCIYNYVHGEELEDDDEYNEIVDNLQDFASKIGKVREFFIPRIDRIENYPAFVRFESSKDAAAALACWDGLVVGGEGLRVVLVDESTSEEDLDWKEKILLSESAMVSGKPVGERSNEGATAVVMVSDFLTNDDYDDEECMIESLEDLHAIAGKCGKLQKLEPRDTRDGSVLMTFETGPGGIQEIIESLQKVAIGGKQLSVGILPQAAKTYESSHCVVVLDNILTEDDLEDEDCMAETLVDIRELVGRHGKVLEIQVMDKAVNVTYEGNRAVAEISANALNGMTLGGVTVTAHVASPPATRDESHYVFLHNILTEDDIEDEDCLQESLNDIRTIASKHGRVEELKVIVDEEGKSLVQIAYLVGAADAVKAALVEFDGMVVGGLIVAATSRAVAKPEKHDEIEEVENGTPKRRTDSDEETLSKKARTDDASPLYSGDKLIPERFAEAKRVPKIPNAPGPREYAKQMNDEQVKPLLTEMLGELMRLQKRAVEENNTKAKRRLVMGLREVARGIRSHKVKMVIMANNLDEYGAIDTKLQEIIDLAHNEEVPLFFEFTKRTLGKALGKSIKIAVVGIQNAEGAHQPFKKLVSLASKI